MDSLLAISACTISSGNLMTIALLNLLLVMFPDEWPWTGRGPEVGRTMVCE
jgi:hypothetical protein